MSRRKREIDAELAEEEAQLDLEEELIDQAEDEEAEALAHQQNLLDRLAAIERNQNRLIELLTEKVGDKVRVRVNPGNGQAATIRARQGRQAARWGISPEEWRFLVGENETIIPPGFDMAEAVAQLRSEQREIADTKPRLRRGAAKRATAAKKKATKKKATKKRATKKRAKKA